PERILMVGDTGCRIKGEALQDCNDPQKWPFPAVAAAAANLRPDLVIHVGDYLYRESPCPVRMAGCAGSPWGDNWRTWAADFFTRGGPPAAPAPVGPGARHPESWRPPGRGFPPPAGPAAFCPAPRPLPPPPLQHRSGGDPPGGDRRRHRR